MTAIIIKSMHRIPVQTLSKLPHVSRHGRTLYKLIELIGPRAFKSLPPVVLLYDEIKSCIWLTSSCMNASKQASTIIGDALQVISILAKYRPHKRAFRDFHWGRRGGTSNWDCVGAGRPKYSGSNGGESTMVVQQRTRRMNGFSASVQWEKGWGVCGA